MFPVTHLFFYSMLFPKDTGGAIGAIYPDTMLLTGLRWPETHKFITELYHKLTPEEHREFKSFIRGMMTHGVDSFGLDYHGDEKYGNHERGYAYLKAEPIITEVVKACRIPESMGLWKAHNFIEMGIEALIGRRYPELRDWIVQTRDDRAEIRKIAEFLSRHYPVDADTFEKGIVDFFQFLIPSGDTMDLGRSYKCVLGIRHELDPDPCEIAAVIDKACHMVENEYMDFLLECREKFYQQWKDVLFTENNEREYATREIIVKNL